MARLSLPYLTQQTKTDLAYLNWLTGTQRDRAGRAKL